MNFANVKGITIPEGAVKALSIDGVKVWEKIQAAVSETLGKVWTQSNITSGHYKEIAYANGVWVTGDYGGTGVDGLLYSEDGKTWTQSNITTCEDIEDIKYANGLFVVATWGNGLYYSENGKTWTQSNITDTKVHEVAYGNGLWLAADTVNGVYQSTDGKTWEKSSCPLTTADRVHFASSLWVAGSCDLFELYYSEDGKNWTLSEINNSNSEISNTDSCRFCYIECVNGRWFASTDKNYYYTYTSVDGKTWVNCISTAIKSVAYKDGVWVAGGRAAEYYYSTDGETWTKSTASCRAHNGFVVCNNLFVSPNYWSPYGIYYSADGLNWESTNVPTTFKGRDALCENGLVVAVGSGGIWYSE